MEMRLKCQRCGHIWDYHGKNQWVAHCPHCKTSVWIAARRVDDEGNYLSEKE